MNARRLGSALPLGVLLAFLTATPASAHAELIASSPAAGEALAAPPQQVVLTFNEPVTPDAAPVSVTGPEGASWSFATASVAGPVVTVPVTPSGPAGAYTLTYRVISSDGDAISGTVAFSLTTAATTTAPPPTTTTTVPTTGSTTESSESAESSATVEEDSGDGGVPVWVWILGGAVVLVAGVLVALRLSRRT